MTAGCHKWPSATDNPMSFRDKGTMATLIGDDYQVKFYCKCVPQIGINIRHFAITGQVIAQPEQELADMISTRFATKYKALLGSFSTYFGCLTQKLVAGLWVTQATSKLGNGIGSNGETLPMQVAGIVTLKTLTPGRRGRGRAYIPFPGEMGNDGTLSAPAPNAAYLANLVLLGNDFDSVVLPGVTVPGNTITLAGAIFHRSTTTFTDIVGITAQAKWATQKRRGSYGRPNADPF